ncbi:hypothetical protein JG687_00015459 [Phytophthora cactorum]|uniref:Uncharacterized protein n=1 Tax=Phytophthora cactorum TaxID=29920 RepID=A0A8T1TUX0_9STRA|nr:hypothetical protein JG687_00015459 [Phytophthora cactorum]
MDNWYGNISEWMRYECGKVPHLDNNTNNRLESKWGKTKQISSKANSIDELIFTLMLLQEVAEDEYLREYHKVGSCPHQDENPELVALAMFLSPFTYDLVVEEFKYATGGRVDYAVRIDKIVANLKSRRSGTEHSVNVKVSFLYGFIF